MPWCSSCATTTITATATLAGLHLTVTRRGQEGVWTAVLSSAKVRHIYTTAHVMTSSFMFLTFLSLCVFLGPLLVYILPFLLALLVFLAFLALWCIRRHKLLPHKVPAPTPALSYVLYSICFCKSSFCCSLWTGFNSALILRCAVTVEDKPVRAVNPTFLQKQQDSVRKPNITMRSSQWANNRKTTLIWREKSRESRKLI